MAFQEFMKKLTAYFGFPIALMITLCMGSYMLISGYAWSAPNDPVTPNTLSHPDAARNPNLPGNSTPVNPQNPLTPSILTPANQSPTPNQTAIPNVTPAPTTAPQVPGTAPQAIGEPLFRGPIPITPPSAAAPNAPVPAVTAIPGGPAAPGVGVKPAVKTILINFNNVSVVELIRFISKISNKNFIFDEDDLQFNVTIVSEEPTSIENIMAALLQELRIHDLTFLEQGNTVVVHKNPNVNSITKVVADNLPGSEIKDTEIITQLFRLNTADPEKVSAILKPLLSQRSIIETFKDTNHIIVTDIVANVQQAAQLIKSLDAPNNGLVIGQYVVRSGYIDSLIQLSQRIIQPISPDQTLIFVPHHAANSIFIVSTPFLMERTMAILQYLDQNQGVTRIFDLKDLKFTPEGIPIPPEGAEGGAAAPAPGTRQGQWEVDQQGNWVFRPLQQPGTPNTDQPPIGYWTVDDQGNWRFQIGTPPPTPQGEAGLVQPEGRWVLDSQGIWVFQLAAGKSISPERLVRPQLNTADLPLGHIERTQFFIYKLRYRHGDQIADAIGRIGQSLLQAGSNNADLIAAIDSIQWIEASNSLIFTGTAEALDKVQELITEIDTPLRQVFIEMLILETTIDDSLTFTVDWGTRFGGGNTAGSQAFLQPGSPLPNALDTAGIGSTPDASSLARSAGYSLGIIGRHLTHGGVHFNSIGALIQALHTDIKSNIVMSPKILTEDNAPAEIFVGINTPYAAQSVVNNNGNILTQNFNYQDVGTRMKITPLIGDNDVITMIIEEEVSSLVTTSVVGSTLTAPTTRKSNTTTKVHIPNEFFLVISGMMQDTDILTKSNVPCLGGIPFIGAAFTDRSHEDHKRNVMLFIRPKIIDTDEEIQNITKHEQNIFKYKSRLKKSWKYEYEEALDYFNLPVPDRCCDELDCDCAME